MRRHTLRRGPSGCVGTVLEPRRPPRSAPGRRRRDGLGQRWALLPRGQRLGRIRRVRNWPVTDWIDIDTLARLLQEGPRAMSVSSPAGLQERQQPQPAIAPLVGSPEPRGQACTLADAPPLLCRRPDCGRPFSCSSSPTGAPGLRAPGLIRAEMGTITHDKPSHRGRGRPAAFAAAAVHHLDA